MTVEVPWELAQAAGLQVETGETGELAEQCTNATSCIHKHSLLRLRRRELLRK